VARVGTNLILVALYRDQFKASYETTVDNRTQAQRLKA
jgi:hypothetical protein